MPADNTLETLAELIGVVDRLRDPRTGCPWDLEQTHTSLIPYVLEEAHEVADAIRHGDDQHLAEELGDLLLQVLLHARIAAEESRFDLEVVARGIRDKLVRRHPHVFEPVGEGETDSRNTAPNRGVGGDSAAVRRDWDAIKAREKAAQTAGEGRISTSTSPSPLADRLRGQVRGQPALSGAMTISRKAAAAGFEWDDLAGVWDKVREELDELKEAVASGDRTHAQEEMGDVLFTLVNVARWCNLDPEEGLAGTNGRFMQRFARVEEALGGSLEGTQLAQLEVHWQAAKAAIRTEQGS